MIEVLLANQRNIIPTAMLLQAEYGCNCHVARSPEQAQGISQDKDLDVAVLDPFDQEYPTADGNPWIEVIDILNVRNIPVILASSLTEQQLYDRYRIGRGKYQGYLKASYVAEQLVNKIDEVREE